MAEKANENKNKRNNGRNRKKKLNMEYSSFSRPALCIPECPFPKELSDALKRNFNRNTDISKKRDTWLDFLELISKIENIQESNYLMILDLLLYLEEYYSNVSMEQYNLEKQRISRSVYSPGQYIIRVPGLVEGRPSLMASDIVKVQKVNHPKEFNLVVTFVGQTYITVLPKKPDFNPVYDEEAQYNVRFHWFHWPIRVCHYAISLMDKYKLTPLLHPVMREVYNQPKKVSSWFNEKIKSNPEQMQAVERILGRTAHPSPYLVFGPPGTGKTATIVEAIMQIWNCKSSDNRILVCAPSNAGADEITKRIMRIIPANLIYRMFSPSRYTEDVDESIHDCSNFIENEVIFLPKELMVRKKIVISTLVTCVRLMSMNLWESHFNYIFIDEAGQATQPETLIPIGLTSSEDAGHIGRFYAQIVLSGDPKQLGPVVMTKRGQHLLGKSMLERFMDCFEIYQKGDQNKYNPNFITKLVKNYRSHDAILQVPNDLFYDDELIACGGKEIYRAENWSELPNKKFPIIFHALHGLEARDESSPSVCNLNEVDVVIKYVSKLIGKTLGGSKVEQKDIGIVTPFRLQRSVILKALKKEGWNDISVGTVEIFQGQEKDVIILSTVRSVLFQNDERFHIGFLSHEKRFNVALTRAKSLLIVIGNPKVLQIKGCWREFIIYCMKNGACVGDKFTLSNMTQHEMKKLLHNRNQEKYHESDETLSVNEEEILEEKIQPIPRNDTLRKSRRLPKVRNEKDMSEREQSSYKNSGMLEVDSGIYSSSNSAIIEERFDGSLEFVQDGLENSETNSDSTSRFSIDDESSLSYSSSFSSDNEADEELFELAKEINQLDLKID